MCIRDRKYCLQIGSNMGVICKLPHVMGNKTQELINCFGKIILAYWSTVGKKFHHYGLRTILSSLFLHSIQTVSYTHLDVYKRQGTYAKKYLILFEFAAVIVCQKKITLDKKSVAGKLPLPLNRSSPKTIGLEYSTNQACMLKIIWFCLNLRLLSFAI